MNDPKGGPGAGGTPDPSDRKPPPRLYVGIGASAGGLEALKQFFGDLSPGTGMAFIVVQHLSPDHKSMMDELLGRRTNLTVTSVEGEVTLEADTVYLIPPRRNTVLAGGSLFLSERVDEPGPPLQIDHFFRALANGAGAQGVAVILSGTGSDGSRGIGLVKGAGGLALVQEPTSAKFDGMPANAVATGQADLVSTPHELAAFLVRYAADPTTPIEAPPLRTQLTTGDTRLDDIFALLRAECRIDFTQYNASTVARRLERRMVANHTPDIGAYLALLRESPREVQTFGRDLLIHVTRFFRDAEAFDRLAENVLATLVERARDGDEIRIWVAGCSTGEEAYTIAILLHEAAERTGATPRVRLFATDVSADVVAEAALGQFGPNLEDEVSPERLARYFVREGGVYTISATIRRTVVFAQQNVLSDPPFSNLDLICCRNMLIYFRQAAQRKVLAGFHFALREDGHLFLGGAESIGDLTEYFRTVSATHRIYTRDRTSPPDLAINQRTTIAVAGASSVRPLLQNYRRRESKVPFEAVKTHLLETFAPTCLVLDRNLDLVHVYGDARELLAPFSSGAVSHRLERMLVPELRTVAQTALAQVTGDGGPTRCTGIPLGSGEGRTRLDLEARRFASPDEADVCYALTFFPHGGRAPHAEEATSYDVNEQAMQRIRDLEHELTRQRENLQITTEELETSNEELRSTNEELMSSNEELQSANEELQSVNEELITVNGEYQEKIGELTVAQDDVDNTLALTATGIVFLDERLRIRKYTSLAGRLFNLMPTDVLRPLRHIVSDLDDPDLHADIERVAATGKASEKVVRSRDGAMVLISLLPYNASSGDEEHRPGGVTIALTDLARRLLDDRAQHLRALVEHSDAVPLPPTLTRPLTARVMLVDGHEAGRSRLATLINEAEHLTLDVIEAASLEGARKAARGRPVDVCIVNLDVEEDEIDALVRELGTATRAAGKIIVSSLSREALAERDVTSLSGYVLTEEALTPLMLELAVRNAVDAARRPELDPA